MTTTMPLRCAARALRTHCPVPAAVPIAARAGPSRSLPFRALATAADAHAEKLTPAQAAFVARTGLAFERPATLLQALTHKSYRHGAVPTQERLDLLGHHALNLFAAEFLHAKYPNLAPASLRDAIAAYTGPAALVALGRSLGVPDVIRWQPTATGETSAKDESSSSAPRAAPPTVVGKTVKALIGALYHERGSVAARKFVHASLLSKDLDIEQLVKLDEPKRMLAALLKRHGKDRPVSRLLHETGRASAQPVFVVGVFSGTRKLGEAAGSSIKMAEHRAAKDALVKHYLLTNASLTLGSDAEQLPPEDQLTFLNAQAVADTPPIL